MQITHQGHHFELLSERALFVPEHSALILSDVHLGKAATFQAQGMAVPKGDDEKDLTRISRLLNDTSAKQLIIAGDLLHSPIGNVTDLLTTWIGNTTIPITLVMGNHDARALRGKLPLEIAEHLQLGNLSIVHNPDDADENFTICGHLHPAIRIKDGPRSLIRSECFWLQEHALILPSFGTFTGGQVVKPSNGDRLFIPLNGRTVEIPVARVS
ncbi:MAG: ligase-associated DNA damage response endonuclease PdeM [Akkermansiaceae bacterium]